MKKAYVLFLALLVAGVFTSTVSAKCYNFRDGDGYKACVKGDGFSDRKKAKKNCKKAKGSDCGNITGYSSSCHSNSGKCVDENGKTHRSLRGY